MFLKFVSPSYCRLQELLMNDHFGSACFVMFLILSGLPTQVEGQIQAGAGTPKAPVHVFYSDPVNGKMSGDGSRAKPWGSIQQIVAARLINGQDKTSGKVHAGDLLYLLNGNHGELALAPWYGKFANTDFITIQAAPGHRPVISGLLAQSCSRWVIRGLTIQGPSVRRWPTISIVQLNSVDNFIVDNNTIYSEADATRWTPVDWSTKSFHYGLNIDGKRSSITNNHISNVENGVCISGDSIRFSANQIDYFANDGLDFSSSNTVISHNVITNHYGQWHNGFHHDGMQGYPASGETSASNIVIDGNSVMASTGKYVTIPAHPTGTGDDYLQGISIFDGVWSNLTITNNVVANSTWHGLSFYGVSNAVIANNTLIKQGAAGTEFVPWIGVFNRKDGTPSSNVAVRNNIASSFNISTAGVVDDHNISFLTKNNGWSDVSSNKTVSDPTKIFVKYDPANASFDLNLKKGSPAIGAGLLLHTPTTDILGRPRLATRVDDGAYVYVGK